MNRQTMDRGIWALIILECGVVIALRDPWITTDSHAYLRLANGIQEAGFSRFGWFYNGEFFAERIRPPGYPLILAALTGWLGWPHLLVVALQMGVYLLAVALVARLARPHGRETLFLLICLACPFAAYYSAVLMTEAWAIGLTTTAFYLIVRQADHSWYQNATLGGITLGAAMLVRANLILMLPLALIGLFAIHKRRYLRERWQAALLCFAAALLMLLPITLMNYREFGALSPLQPTPSTGSSLYQAVWQRDLRNTNIDGYIHKGEAAPELELVGFVQQNVAMNRRIGAPDRMGLTTEEYPVHLQVRADAEMQASGLERIRQRPLAYAKHVLRNLFELGNPRSYPKATPEPIILLLRIIMAAVWITGLTAILIARRQAPAVMVGAAVASWVMLVSLIWFVTEPRYMAPVLLLIFLNASLAVPPNRRMHESPPTA